MAMLPFCMEKLDKKILAKTLLSSLASFEKFMNAFNKGILNHAQFSYANYFDTARQVNELCELVQDNHNLRRLRQNLDALLRRAPLRYEKIIRMYYQQELSSRQCASAIGVSDRTFFRYLSSALDWFTRRIDEVIDTEQSAHILQTNAWLKNIYNRIKSN